MIQLHATQKLFKRLPLTTEGLLARTPHSEWLFQQPTLDINPLNHWHGNLITMQRRTCILMVHDATRFPLFLPGLTKPDLKKLNDRFTDALMNTLLKCGANEEQMTEAHYHLRPLEVDTQCNRSVQGTLNRLKDDLEYWLYYHEISVAEITGYRASADMAGLIRGIKGKDYVVPKEAMLTLLDRLESD